MRVAGGGEVEAWVAERRPGWSLPQQMYLSPQAFERDMARVFMGGWSFVGHIARIPAVGDYFLHEIGDESIVVMRSGGEDTAVCSRPGGLLRAQRLRPVQPWQATRGPGVGSCGRR